MVINKPGGFNASLVFKFFDRLLALTGLLFLSPVLVIIFFLCLFDTGAPFFFQKRVGRGKSPFTLIKFRTMKPATQSVATHLVDASSITSLGRFLRKAKLDEIPQLINVLKGEMSLVGPRPCLFTQHELINEREKRQVYNVLPGITGLAQVNEIDMSTPEMLAEYDSKMIDTLSLKRYFAYIFMTISGKGKGDRIRD